MRTEEVATSTDVLEVREIRKRKHVVRPLAFLNFNALESLAYNQSHEEGEERKEWSSLMSYKTARFNF